MDCIKHTQDMWGVPVGPPTSHKLRHWLQRRSLKKQKLPWQMQRIQMQRSSLQQPMKRQDCKTVKRSDLVTVLNLFGRGAWWSLPLLDKLLIWHSLQAASEFEAAGGGELKKKVEQVLNGLGFTNGDAWQRVRWCQKQSQGTCNFLESSHLWLV